jgi:hypothetical protein
MYIILFTFIFLSYLYYTILFIDYCETSGFKDKEVPYYIIYLLFAPIIILFTIIIHLVQKIIKKWK